MYINIFRNHVVDLRVYFWACHVCEDLRYWNEHTHTHIHIYICVCVCIY